MHTIPFPKHYQSPQQLVELLKKRGLHVRDEEQAIADIRNIGYYRLSAYLYPFLAAPKEAQMFKTGSEFDTAVSIYEFDHRLRVLMFREIGKIEIAFRSAMANIVAKESGNIFWMTDATLFVDRERYRKTVTAIEHELGHTKEEFISHFKSKYSNPYPPAWMLAEILPLGTLNHLYGNLANNVWRKKIAAQFSLPAPVFGSWLTIITLMRNACCHHARVWNKENAIPPVSPRKPSRPWIASSVTTNRLFYDLCIIKWFLDIISPGNDMKRRISDLLSAYPMVDTRAMGFPPAWQEEPLWK